MRVLIDECVPRALKSFLIARGHDCSTVQDAGWSGTTNGELLRLAEKSFEVFLTLDKKIEHQQNLAARKITIMVIRSISNRLKLLRPHFPAFAAAIESSKPGEIVFIDADSIQI